MSVEFKENTKTYNRVVRNMDTLKNAYVKIGLIENKKVASPIFIGSEHTPITDMQEMVDIACAHEFGSEKHNIPARPFMKPTIDNNKEKLDRLMESLLDNVIAGINTPNTALKALGEEGVGLIKQQIDLVNSPALHQRTIDKKKSEKPLIDRGQMKESMDYEVYTNG